MVTYLSALRWAANVEQHLQQLQKERFARTGDIASRALPPLIPLQRHRRLPEFPWLDEIRWAHTVSVAATRPESAEIPPARIALSGQGLDETARHIVELQRALAADQGDDPPQFAPQIVISWQEATPQASPVALPETSALWLSIIELDCGEDPWWEFLSWNQRYCRRLRAR
ncbi:MAG: hypothetical protein ACOCU4_05595 [Alkalispirochaeta sp.]